MPGRKATAKQSQIFFLWLVNFLFALRSAAQAADPTSPEPSSTMDAFTGKVDSRPAKRRRVEMTGPEGFLESAGAPPKPAHKPTVPPFKSAFGDVEIAVKPKYKAKEVAPVKHFMKKPLSRRMPQDASTSRDAIEASTSRRVDAETASKPPKIVSVHDIHKEFAIDALSKSKPQLHPAPPPPVLVDTSAPKAPLRQIAAPVFQAKPPSKALQPIQPPANPILPTSRHHLQAGKDLRTLSTTGLGMLTDLSENSAEDLASILLRDQNKELYAHTRDDATRRGLELSPEKKGRDGVGKFVRCVCLPMILNYRSDLASIEVVWQRGQQVSLIVNAPHSFYGGVKKNLSCLAQIPSLQAQNSPRQSSKLYIAHLHHPLDLLQALRQQQSSPYAAYIDQMETRTHFSKRTSCTKLCFRVPTHVRAQRNWED